MIEHEPKPESKNPFSSEHSGYGVVKDGILISQYSKGSDMEIFHQTAHDYFVDLVTKPDFACVAGQTVVKTDNYAFCVYPDMTSQDTAEGLCYDLLKFGEEFGIPNKEKNERGMFRSFIAAFPNTVASQMHGAELLYTLLKNMHQKDAEHFEWARGISSDTDHPDFGFSIGEVGYFLPSFHPYTSSLSRRSEMNFVVFNAHSIFEVLRKQGKFQKLKDIIRARQPYVHPHLGDHGQVNEWVQYALVDSDQATQQEEKALRRQVFGECPFGHT